MTSAAADRARRLEVRSRRAGVEHPDAMAKLPLRGATFAVRPPRAAMTFQLGGDGPADCRACEPPDAMRLRELAELIRRNRRAGRLRLDGADGRRLLCGLAEFAAVLLRGQYDLDDEQIAELLSFPLTGEPLWPGAAAAMVLEAVEPPARQRAGSSAIGLAWSLLSIPLRWLGLAGR